MTSKLDVTVAVDIDSGTITVTPTGKLTLQNARAITPVAHRAASLAPDLILVLDLGKLTSSEPGATAALTSSGPKGTRILEPGVHHTAQSGPPKPHRAREPWTAARWEVAT